MIPLPSELILPFAGFLVSDPTAIEPLTGGPWNFWLVVIFATIGNTLGSLIAYYLGRLGGRPFLERYGKYLLIRPHEIELADQFFTRYGAATAFFPGCFRSSGRSSVSRWGGPDAGRQVRPLFDVGAFLWSILLVFAGLSSVRTGRTSVTPSSRSTS